MALGEEERRHLGPKIASVVAEGLKAEGGTSGTPGVADELSGGVMGLSPKHQ